MNLQRKFEKMNITEFGGIGKKRTFRELERWEIHNETAKSVVNSTDTKSIDNERKSIKFNSRLLHKANTAVDLISQKIEFKNMMA